MRRKNGHQRIPQKPARSALTLFFCFFIFLFLLRSRRSQPYRSAGSPLRPGKKMKTKKKTKIVSGFAGLVAASFPFPFAPVFL
jgi:hypothetical protein